MSEQQERGNVSQPRTRDEWRLSERERLAGTDLARDDLRRERARTRYPLPEGGMSAGYTLQEALLFEQVEQPFAVKGLARVGQIITLPATRKSGKSTLISNLARAAVDELPFLDRFTTALDPGDRFGIWDCEMQDGDYVQILRGLDVKRGDGVRIINLRGRSMPFATDEELRAWTIAWLRHHRIKWWVLDPWKNVCRWHGVGLNDNDGVQDLMQAVQDVQVEAGLELVLIPMHTNQAGDERGKGAGELEDSADAMWRYMREGHTRVLTVEGRGVGLNETAVEFDQETGRLWLGTGDRKEGRREKISAKILGFLMDHPNATSGEVKAHVGGKAEYAVDALAVLERQGSVTMTKDGPAKRYRVALGADDLPSA